MPRPARLDRVHPTAGSPAATHRFSLVSGGPLRTLCLCLLLPATTLSADGLPEPALVTRGHFPSLSPVSPVSPDPSTTSNSVADARDLSAARRGTDFPAPVQSAEATAQPEGNGRLQSLTPVVTVGSSLLIVLALFAGLVWVTRKLGGNRGSQTLPAEVMRPIGHTMLDARTKLTLVRCGRRLLVLCQTAGGVTPVSEIHDPDEIRELLAHASADARASFEATLREFESQPVRGGFVEPHEPADASAASRRLFATA